MVDADTGQVLTPWHSSCLDCGGPQNVAPELISKLGDPEGTYFVKQPVTNEEIRAACLAIRSCCNDSLFYRGTKPETCRMLKNEADVE